MAELFAPDFKKACDAANEILVCSGTIKSFPFLMEAVIREITDIELAAYSELKKLNCNPEKITGSKDGALNERNGRYIMFINDAMPEQRQKFTLAHETGHYFLGHDIKKLTEYRETGNKRFGPLYKKFEAETNMFAAQLLMPEQVIIELSKRGCRISKEFIAEAFNASEQAAQIRLNTIRKVYDWNSRKKKCSAIDYDDIILQKFKRFIDGIAPQKISYVDEYERDYEMERIRQSWQ